MAKRLQDSIKNCQVRLGARHVATAQRYDVRNPPPKVKPAGNDSTWDREESQRGIDLMVSRQSECMPVRQKDIASHLDDPRLVRAFPQSPNPHDGNAVFDDRSVKRTDPRCKDCYVVTPLDEGSCDLLASRG